MDESRNGRMRIEPREGAGRMKRKSDDERKAQKITCDRLGKGCR